MEPWVQWEAQSDCAGRPVLTTVDDQPCSGFLDAVHGCCWIMPTSIAGTKRTGAGSGHARLISSRRRRCSRRNINRTEGRARVSTQPCAPDGLAVIRCDGAGLDAWSARNPRADGGFCASLRAGRMQGSGSSYTMWFNSGIGGSESGPAMACCALDPITTGRRCHFVSTSRAHIADTLKVGLRAHGDCGLDPSLRSKP